MARHARVTLKCADGRAMTGAAKPLHVSATTVCEWRTRFLRDRVDRLYDEPRPGAPRRITDEQIERVIIRTLESTRRGATQGSTLRVQARVNGNLALEFGAVNLTSYAGLELFQRYLRTMRFNDLIRAAFGGTRLGGDFGVLAMIRLLVGLLVVGGRRLDHVAYVADDPVFLRFCRLRVLPTARTVSRWLRQFTMKTVERLQALNAAVIAHVIPGLRLHTVTVDVNGKQRCDSKVLEFEQQVVSEILCVPSEEGISRARGQPATLPLKRRVDLESAPSR